MNAGPKTLQFFDSQSPCKGWLSNSYMALEAAEKDNDRNNN
jgi:hypothetical protein